MTHGTSELAGLRVILVGRTGLDAALRRHPDLELVRARTTVDALGELADPLAGAGHSVVIVDPRAEPASTGPGDLAEFIAGLRRVDPQVRILRVASNGDALPTGYDGSIDPEHARETLTRFIERGDTPPEPQHAVEPKPVPQHAPPRRRAPAPPARGTPGAATETGLLRRLIDGAPILAPALDAIRERAGVRDIVFVTPDEKNASADWTAWVSAPVRLGGSAAAGELRARGIDADSLSAEALWLGAWLELEARQNELRDAAHRDPLTGAWNRRFFDAFLPRAIDEARNGRRALTVLVFDIDDFKRFNDRHGHAAGDEILAECVRLIQAVVRPTDKVCRIGGDEFAVIFYEPEGPREPDSRHPASVFDIAERFCAQVRSARFRKLGDDAPGHLTISGGLATFPWDGRNAQELVERADQLALEGKHQGKNVITIGPGCRRLGEA